MQKWMIKALMQGVFARTPMKNSLNYFAQRYITKSLVASKRPLDMRLRWTGMHLANFQEVTGRELPHHVLELGTGWFPTVPIALWLCGVDAITTVDIVTLLKPSYFRPMFRLLASYTLEEFQQSIPLIKPERYAALKAMCQRVDDQPVPDTLRQIGLHSIVADARHMPSADRSFDLIVSNTTLEHIALPILTGIWQEFRRVIAADGAMSHLIDMTDHYAHFDSSINQYNYLRYDERVWRWFNNDLLYQNRLRVTDYQRLHEANGFRIVKQNDNRTLAAYLDKVPVSDAFKAYTRDELIPTTSWIISTPS